MLKNLSQLEYVVDGKVYHFNCSMDAPLTHVKDALNKFIQYVGQIEDNIAEQQRLLKEKEEFEKNQALEQPVEEKPIEG